jgi:8-oxo-dGTP pyrophosphatase MutT (NUDIX family)
MPEVRPAARVVLLDEDDRLLMLRIHDPSAARGPNPITADFWLLVGGGVRAGETYEEAARREVLEETGFASIALGRCVWTQEKLVADSVGKLVVRQARYYVARVMAGPVDFSRHEPLEASTIVGCHWFTRAEILAGEPRETFLPPSLGMLLGDVLAGGPATDPISLTDPSQL